MRALFTQPPSQTINDPFDSDFRRFLPTCNWITSLFNVNHQRVRRCFDDGETDDFTDDYTDSVLTIKSKLSSLLVSSSITGYDNFFLSKQIKLVRGDLRWNKSQSQDKFNPHAWTMDNPHDMLIKTAMTQDDINQILVLIQNIIHVQANDRQILTWYDELLTLLSSQLPLSQLILQYHQAAVSDKNYFRDIYHTLQNQCVYSSSRITNLSDTPITRWLNDYAITEFTFHQWELNSISGYNIILTDYVSPTQLSFWAHNIGVFVDQVYFWAISPVLQYTLSSYMIDTPDGNSVKLPLAPAAIVAAQ